MAISLTNQNLTPYAGQAAYLPNQPILDNCVVSASQGTPLVPGAIVTFATDANLGYVTPVKQAAVTDQPLGVIVGNPIKSGFNALERVSVFPVNSYVYLPAASGTINPGDQLQFNANNQVAATSTASNGYIGIAMTGSTVEGEFVVVQIQPGMQAAG